MRSPSSQARRFTLIELLVVVAIIAILASLLLPSLSKARERGRTTYCMNNQKQQFFAVMSYVDEHHDWLPVNGYDPTGRHHANWSGAVAHYSSTAYYTEWSYNNVSWPNECKYVGLASAVRNNPKPSLLKCPSDRYRNVWATSIAVSYGWNGNPWGLGGAHGFRIDYSSAYWDLWGPIKISAVTHPASTVMTGEYLMADGYYEYYYYSQLATTRQAFYHNGGGNYLWADGHAQFKQSGTVTAADLDRRD